MKWQARSIALHGVQDVGEEGAHFRPDKWKAAGQEAMFDLEAHVEWACWETRNRRCAEPGFMRSQGGGTPLVR